MKRTDLLAMLDLTLLDRKASEQDIRRVVGLADEHGVAAVCVFSEQAGLASKQASSRTRIAAVAGPFPEGAADLERYLLPIQEAIAGGAVEIDLVLEPGIGLEASMMVLNGVRMATEGLALKVIIETPILDERAVRGAARMALMAGADFVKTCTGRRGGCSKEATRWVSEEIRRHEVTTGERAGLKLSGGIRDLDGLNGLLDVVRSVDPGIIDQGRLRIGASSLIESLI